MMFDFHSHILPHMDDGSDSVDTSLCMMQSSFAMGVSDLAATPHFYADQESPEEFLARRSNAAHSLAEKYDPKTCPNIYLGAEVAFFHGLSRCEMLKELCLFGTEYLLVEMPFDKWSSAVIDEVLYLREGCRVVPVIAHIERYMAFQPKDLPEFLVRNGVLFQANAEAFLSLRLRRKMKRMIDSGTLHFLGTDCHNMSDRAPNMADALSAMEKIPEESVEQIVRFAVGASHFAQPFLKRAVSASV